MNMTTATPQPVPLADAKADPFCCRWRLVPRPAHDNPRHLEPDVMVIPGVRKRRNWNTFEVAVEQARPALIIDIVLLDARENDVVIKVEHYA
jgi:Uma2 family endonuclease